MPHQADSTCEHSYSFWFMQYLLCSDDMHQGDVLDSISLLAAGLPCISKSYQSVQRLMWHTPGPQGCSSCPHRAGFLVISVRKPTVATFKNTCIHFNLTTICCMMRKTAQSQSSARPPSHPPQPFPPPSPGSPSPRSHAHLENGM